MEILRYISGPVIGAVIGYFTNYIAVKMLFCPKREIRIFRRTLPFTPGAIPKGKARLANSAGKVVSDNLITSEALRSQLLDERIESEIADIVSENLSRKVKDELCLLTGASPADIADKKIQISSILSNEIVRAIDVKPLVNEKGGELIKSHIHGSVFKKLISEKKIRSLTEAIGTELQALINKEGADHVRPIVEDKLTDAGEHSAIQLLEKMDISDNDIRTAVISAYRSIVSEYADKLFEQIDISGIVTDKINEMSIDELERLVLDMMKSELGLIVDLGAIIGFVIGIINIFI